MAKKRRVTKTDVSNWIGNHGYSDKRDEWMLEVIAEVANGEYNPKLLRDEIIEYND